MSVYSALKGTWSDRKGQLVIDVKAGSTSQWTHTRMQGHKSACVTGKATCTRFLPSENEWITCSANRGYFLGSRDLFFEKSDSRFCQAKLEQKVINSVRKAVMEFQSNDIDFVVHNGLPNDNRSNPASQWYVYKKITGIDEDFYERLIAEICSERDRLISSLSERCKLYEHQIRELEEKMSEINKELRVAREEDQSWQSNFTPQIKSLQNLKIS